MYAPPGQPMIYGAHGQPLGPIPPQGQDPNYPPPPQGYGPGPFGGPMYDDRGPPQPAHPQEQVSRKRPRIEEPSHLVIPAPAQGPSLHPYPQQQHLSASTGNRRGSGGGAYEYPDPTHMAPVSPSSSTTSYQSTAYPSQTQAQPYYPTPGAARRTSPQSAYSYEARASASPHGSTSTTSGYAAFPSGLHPPQVLPPTREGGRTPPPGQGREGNASGNGSRAGLSVRDMLGPGDGQGGRTSADSEMLKALTKRGM